MDGGASRQPTAAGRSCGVWEHVKVEAGRIPRIKSDPKLEAIQTLCETLEYLLDNRDISVDQDEREAIHRQIADARALK